ncbi:hypothetical protein GH714_036580 [Hevea brasiliensis]|uniref:Retrovirus-related Pol polyprotein from transposon TNT 1-94-like beta-barrel domain-containing protein n=1 Tax=Hevea brasiliensis TaxID=3981 RepID=A0A6A6LSB6_HEVBR|nr:hypothetical protein GH714_036580 [Hevea brasiliensis]
MALATACNEVVNYKDDWIVDSGCSNHMTGDTGKLSDMLEYKGSRDVVTADNSKLLITHIASGNFMVFKPHDVKVYRSLKATSELIMEGKWFELVYLMTAQIAYVDKTRKNETVDLWHARLGHVSYQNWK